MKVKGKNTLIFGLAVFLMCGFLPAASFALDVTVYGEAAYTDTDVVVYIYADVEASTHPLCSFGVKLTYPSALDLDMANTGTDTATWFLGSSDYEDVYEETDATVLIGGKLDPGAPTVGVHGTRVLLGIVTLNHTGATMPPSPALELTYGKGGDYKNFVCANGTVLDDDPPTSPNNILFEHPVYTVPVKTVERGDSNADGSIDIRDIRTLRQNIGNSDAPVWNDCNGDGAVDIRDLRCLRQKI